MSLWLGVVLIRGGGVLGVWFSFFVSDTISERYLTFCDEHIAVSLGSFVINLNPWTRSRVISDSKDGSSGSVQAMQ